MTSLCAGTPTITVRDNRSLTVRTLRYNRGAAGDVATQYVEAQTYNDLRQLTASQDARFFAQAAGKAGTLNFQYTPALSGQVLQTVSADAGTTRAFADIEGRPVWQTDARGTLQQFSYDALGRPLSRSETLDGQAVAVRERWVYSDAELPTDGYDPSAQHDPRNANQRGQCVQHYDTAGLLDTGAVGYVLQGAPQRQDRTLLPAEIPSDWRGASAADWQAPLVEQTPYATAWAYNAAGQVLTQTDARGHRQRSAYDIAGRKAARWVMPQGQAERSVTPAITYTAGGQIEAQTDANGITTATTYEAQTTQRVLRIKVTRKAPSTVLQDLAYTYDAVGNVIGVTDSAAQTAYFDNQAIIAARTYAYDTLYQLLSASGRENAVGSPSGTDAPAAFAPPDLVNYRNYTRTYVYDLGGNLTGLTPGNAAPKRSMTVAAVSNRAVSGLNATGVTAEAVDGYFDAAGNANCLDGNRLQPLTWTGLNQLQSLVTLQRNATDQKQNDRESYAYGGDGQRVRKTSFAKASGTNWNQTDAIYLSGLEIRTTPTETLEVIVLDDGTRVLNWTANKPSDIANQQIRYRYGDRQNSCQLETDQTGAIITQEEYYPYGGTAVWAATSTSEAKYKTIRYSGKERDASGLYYYGFRYYQPWIGRWINPDPAGTVDGLNLYCMVRNNSVTLQDTDGCISCVSPNENRYEEIENKIHYVWIGEKESKFKIDNLLEFKNKNPSYEVNIHLDIPSSSRQAYESKLGILRDNNVRIHNIEQSDWFIKSAGNYPNLHNTYTQIRDERQTHLYCAAADIARYQIVFAHGGIYSDMDDRFKPRPEGAKESEYPFFDLKAKKNQVLVSSSTTHPISKKGTSFINNSSFAAHQGSEALSRLAQSIDRDLSQNFIEEANQKKNKSAGDLFDFIADTTGPRKFTEVLLSGDLRLKGLVDDIARNSKNKRSRGFTSRDTSRFQKRMPFFYHFNTGGDNSWR